MKKKGKKKIKFVMGGILLSSLPRVNAKLTTVQQDKEGGSFVMPWVIIT